MELSLISYKIGRNLPSMIAAASLYLSLKLTGFSEWSETLQYYSGYSEQQLMPVVRDIATLVLSPEAAKYEAVRVKYASRKLMSVSKSDLLTGSTIKKIAAEAVKDS